MRRHGSGKKKKEGMAENTYDTFDVGHQIFEVDEGQFGLQMSEFTQVTSRVAVRKRG